MIVYLHILLTGPGALAAQILVYRLLGKKERPECIWAAYTIVIILYWVIFLCGTLAALDRTRHLGLEPPVGCRAEVCVILADWTQRDRFALTFAQEVRTLNVCR